MVCHRQRLAGSRTKLDGFLENIERLPFEWNFR